MKKTGFIFLVIIIMMIPRKMLAEESTDAEIQRVSDALDSLLETLMPGITKEKYKLKNDPYTEFVKKIHQKGFQFVKHNSLPIYGYSIQDSTGMKIRYIRIGEIHIIVCVDQKHGILLIDYGLDGFVSSIQSNPQLDMLINESKQFNDALILNGKKFVSHPIDGGTPWCILEGEEYQEKYKEAIEHFNGKIK